MSKFKVTWEIELDADSPSLAALEAFFMQKDTSYFCVQSESGEIHGVDLSRPTGENVEKLHDYKPLIGRSKKIT